MFRDISYHVSSAMTAPLETAAPRERFTKAASGRITATAKTIRQSEEAAKPPVFVESDSDSSESGEETVKHVAAPAPPPAAATAAPPVKKKLPKPATAPRLQVIADVLTPAPAPVEPVVKVTKPRKPRAPKVVAAPEAEAAPAAEAAPEPAKPKRTSTMSVLWKRAQEAKIPGYNKMKKADIEAALAKLAE